MEGRSTGMHEQFRALTKGEAHRIKHYCINTHLITPSQLYFAYKRLYLARSSSQRKQAWPAQRSSKYQHTMDRVVALGVQDATSHKRRQSTLQVGGMPCVALRSSHAGVTGLVCAIYHHE